MSNNYPAPRAAAGAFNPPAAGSNKAQVAVQSNREIAEVQAAAVMAKQFPRDYDRALGRILNDCARAKLAESALYTYARGGSEITGPSIRLAECLAQNWGNMEFGIKELEQRPGASVVLAFAWDMETNTRQTKTFEVPHIRHTKKGSYTLEDPRDIYEAVANNGARRLRACILGIIPGDIVEAAVKQCEATLKATADTSKEGISKLLETFEKQGVTRADIEAFIQRKAEAITSDQTVRLRKIYTSIRDGIAHPSEFFKTISAPVGKLDASGKPIGGVQGLAAKIGAPVPEETPIDDIPDSPQGE